MDLQATTIGKTIYSSSRPFVERMGTVKSLVRECLLEKNVRGPIEELIKSPPKDSKGKDLLGVAAAEICANIKDAAALREFREMFSIAGHENATGKFDAEITKLREPLVSGELMELLVEGPRMEKPAQKPTEPKPAEKEKTLFDLVKALEGCRSLKGIEFHESVRAYGKDPVAISFFVAKVEGLNPIRERELRNFFGPDSVKIWQGRHRDGSRLLDAKVTLSRHELSQVKEAVGKIQYGWKTPPARRSLADFVSSLYDKEWVHRNEPVDINKEGAMTVLIVRNLVGQVGTDIAECRKAIVDYFTGMLGNDGQLSADGKSLHWVLGDPGSAEAMARIDVGHSRTGNRVYKGAGANRFDDASYYPEEVEKLRIGLMLGDEAESAAKKTLSGIKKTIAKEQKLETKRQAYSK